MTEANSTAMGLPGYWWSSISGGHAQRPPLNGRQTVDVAIVGGGFTGLWTAYYLAEADPSLKIAIVEKEFAGFGASGRNGGWISGEFPGNHGRYLRDSSRGQIEDFQARMFETVDEIERVLLELGIDCDLTKGGSIQVALNAAQEDRLRHQLHEEHSWGTTTTDYQWLDAEAVRDRIRVNGAQAGIYTPHCSCVHPAKLVEGLARAVERQGTKIYEKSAAATIEQGLVATGAGALDTKWIVMATEGYSPEAPSAGRRLVPVNSSILATTPLSEEFWDSVGWRNRETLIDGAYGYVYLQRTKDDRIVIGGRGTPYRFGSRTHLNSIPRLQTVESLRKAASSLFPQLHGVPVTHAWSGAVGMSRDWCSFVDADYETGMASAGGYVGNGLSTANLAGRTLRDLILERPSDLTRLPWVGHRPRSWEPEPARFVGIRATYKAFIHADQLEARSKRISQLGRLATWVSGR